MIRAGKDKNGLPYLYSANFPVGVYLISIVGIAVGAITSASFCNARKLYHESIQNQDEELNSRKQESWLESQTTKPSEEIRKDFVKECPRCKSPYWNKERKFGKNEM